MKTDKGEWYDSNHYRVEVQDLSGQESKMSGVAVLDNEGVIEVHINEGPPLCIVLRPTKQSDADGKDDASDHGESTTAE